MTAYAESVAAGRETAGRLAKLACERHLADYPAHNGHYFDEKESGRALEFFERFLRHSKGEWAGQPIELQPWQRFVIGSMFGWMRSDKTRRFREAFIELARKNGKTLLAAGVGLYLMDGDGEPGAEIYSVATKRDQAKLSWSDAANMVRQSPPLRSRIQRMQLNLSCPATMSKFEPLSSEEDTMDGLNPSGVVIDELHAHKTRGPYDKMKTALGSRRQPMLMSITTAGDDDDTTVYAELRDYSESVLNGWRGNDFRDDSLFAFIAAIDETDDAFDEACWTKANPNLEISVKLDYLREQALKASAQPSFLPTFLRFHMGRRMSMLERAIDLDAWDRCRGHQDGRPVDWKEFDGAECVGAIDLSSTTDLTALALHFERDGLHYYRFFSWLPQEQLRVAEERDRVPYGQWVREGWLELTPGASIDDSFVARRVAECSERYQVVQWTHDPWHATQLGNRLAGECGIEIVKFLQDLKSFGEPTQAFLDEISTGHLRHDGNPLARWCAGNVVTKEDAHGNKRPHKRASRKRIDPITAAIMARGRAMVLGPTRRSVYEDMGL